MYEGRLPEFLKNQVMDFSNYKERVEEKKKTFSSDCLHCKISHTLLNIESDSPISFCIINNDCFASSNF